MKATVLVVDDDIEVIAALTTACRRCFPQATIVGVDRGEALRAHLDTLDPCLVLLDLVLERQSGLHLLSEIRRSHPAMPVVMMSRYPAEEARYVAKRLGVVAFEQKPEDARAFDALARVLRTFCDAARHDRDEIEADSG